MRLLRLMVPAVAVLLLSSAPAHAAKPMTDAQKRELAALKKLKPVTGVLKAKIGIADQKADVFEDARFAGLGLKDARRSVAWDAMQYDWQVAELDNWMLAARRAGVRPLITFARSRVHLHAKPSAQQIRTAFLAFRARYPWVKNFVASNESNHFGEPTGRNPKLAVQHYKAMRAACRTCKIAAATLLDQPNMVSWAKAFVRHAKEQPRYWALHNYLSANRFDPIRTRQLLVAVKGEIWMTEVAGLVKRRTADRPGKAKLTEGIGHAAKVMRFIFDRLARTSPRITRIYLYHWNAKDPLATWDSGLIGTDGRTRPAFDALVSALGRIRGEETVSGEV